MTITLNLTPEEHEALRRRAEADGTGIESVLHGLIAALTPPLPPGDATGDLLDDPDDPEERAERDREREEVQANLARWRAEQGQPIREAEK